MMRQQHRLRPLQVGVAGDDDRLVLLGDVDQRALEGVDGGEGLDDCLHEEEAQVGRHLVVAGAGGVEAAGGVADLLRQARLDVGVDVFQAVIEDELAPIDLPLDVAQAADDALGVGVGNDAPAAEHAGVRYRRPNVLAVESGVHIQRAGIEVDQGMRLLGEAAAPGLASLPPAWSLGSFLVVSHSHSFGGLGLPEGRAKPHFRL